MPAAEPVVDDSEVLVVQERGRVERIRLAEVLYFRAEQKQVLVRTLHDSRLIDDSLTELEGRVGSRFIRVHRNALVSRQAMKALERRADDPMAAKPGPCRCCPRRNGWRCRAARSARCARPWRRHEKSQARGLACSWRAWASAQKPRLASRSSTSPWLETTSERPSAFTTGPSSFGSSVWW